jgi:hypothetical protein
MNKMVYILSVVFISAVISFFANAQDHWSESGKGDGPGTGQSNDSIPYTIWNTTNYHVNIKFFPTKNTTSLAPGVKKSCNSPIKNGQFPKVKAYASNGATWLRTISVRGGEYRIINRTTDTGAPGIQIVP